MENFDNNHVKDKRENNINVFWILNVILGLIFIFYYVLK